MKLEPPFRRATSKDARRIAELFRIASDGVAEYVWSTLAPEYPGLAPLEIGVQRYAREDNPFGFKNCVIAERDADVLGMLVTFPIAQPAPAGEGTGDRTEDRAPDPVLAPYAKLEKPGTWYICAMAVFPRYRRQGLGSALLDIARAQAREHALRELSLIVFEQNHEAVRLYERNGFRVIDRAPVVPHPLIRYGGDALLMTASASTLRALGS